MIQVIFDQCGHFMLMVFVLFIVLVVVCRFLFLLFLNFSLAKLGNLVLQVLICVVERILSD